MINEIKKTIKGLAIINEWLGEGGKAVPSDLSSQRAAVCVSCPHNIKGKWWEKAEGVVADAIRSQLQVKEEQKAETAYDETLGTCSICLCNLLLKVHCPIENIKNHTPEEELNRLPPYCWQVIEGTK